jgi:ubiquinone/menaquinone biosynthesis C-methylase UbiE
MPAPVENGMMIPTLDRQGWIWLYKDEVTESYIKFASETEGLMLEIGAGYGHIVLEVLKKNARAIAVDISQEQLEIIKSRAAASGLSGLQVIKAEFPEELDLPAGSIDGVLISRVFHFFNGERIRKSLRKVHSWLRSGGKVFIVSDSVYRAIFKELIPRYENNVADGVEWPGWVENVRNLIPQDKLDPDTQPLAMNFTDPGIWRRELAIAGFTVEASSFFRYPAEPYYARLDGREIVGAIGIK